MDAPEGELPAEIVNHLMCPATRETMEIRTEPFALARGFTLDDCPSCGGRHWFHTETFAFTAHD